MELALFIAFCVLVSLGCANYLMRVYKIPSHKYDMPIEPETVVETSPVEPPASPETPLPEVLQWDTQKRAYHSVRVICDEMGLTVAEKNLICACIYQESTFLNTAVGKNATSTDWGICQINDYYHIGDGKSFTSVEYVLEHPEEVVRWMIRLFKQGKLDLWVSYKSGAYKKLLIPTSPMWKLKV